MGEALRKRLQITRELPAGPEAFLSLLVAADTVRRELETACTGHGITHAQYNVLRILKGAQPDGLSRCEIARRMIDHAPDVTRLVDRLEAQGLAKRVRDKGDRRLSITCITRQGIELVDRVTPDMHKVEQSRSKRLSAAELREMARLCEKFFEE